MGYLLGGAILWLPYFFIPTAHIALLYPSLLTGIVLLVFDVVKARDTGAAGKGAGGYVWGALSTLAVDGAAAAAAYGIVAMFEGKE
jgi:VIT1/CCC1 family predicted Fe2+/Mn2+ transporter